LDRGFNGICKSLALEMLPKAVRCAKRKASPVLHAPVLTVFWDVSNLPLRPWTGRALGGSFGVSLRLAWALVAALFGTNQGSEDQMEVDGPYATQRR